MFFNSLDFAIFLTLCVSVYCALGLALSPAAARVAQNRVLLIASYLFYAAWDWRFTFLIAFSTVVDYAVAIGMDRTDDARRRKILVSISLAVNLGLLAFFKYAGFFAESLRALFLRFGVELPESALAIVLPVGISFYTFQTLSYTIDVYRGLLRPTRSFFDFALYVAFFPQLVAGPIERATTFLPQILGNRSVTLDKLTSGSWLIFWGIFKKVVIADNLARMVQLVYAPGSDPTSAEMWLATYAFTMQIYCDFSGYTDIARGAARLMGFELMLNFRLPYFATSPANFWQRWHISLSTWLRDYLFIPLGGNSRGSTRAALNLGITMLLGGLWHGAAWPFVLWGGYHGILLGIHRATLPLLRRVDPAGQLGRAVWHGVRVFVTFHLVAFGLLMFRSESLAQVMSHAALLAAPWSWGSAPEWLLPFAVLLAPLVLMQIAQARTGDLEIVLKLPIPARAVIYALLAFMIVVLGEDGGDPFIYFQF